MIAFCFPLITNPLIPDPLPPVHRRTPYQSNWIGIHLNSGLSSSIFRNIARFA
jgi:hypothetical protein